MTRIGAGGVVIAAVRFTERFQRDYRKLSAELQARTQAKLQDFLWSDLLGYCADPKFDPLIWAVNQVKPPLRGDRPGIGY